MNSENASSHFPSTFDFATSDWEQRRHRIKQKTAKPMSSSIDWRIFGLDQLLLSRCLVSLDITVWHWDTNCVSGATEGWLPQVLLCLLALSQTKTTQPQTTVVLSPNGPSRAKQRNHRMINYVAIFGSAKNKAAWR